MAVASCPVGTLRARQPNRRRLDDSERRLMARPATASSSDTAPGDLSGLPQNGSAGVARELLTAEEVAAMLGMGVDWVWAQARRGRIPHVKLGRFRRFRRQAILVWLEQMERGEVNR